MISSSQMVILWCICLFFLPGMSLPPTSWLDRKISMNTIRRNLRVVAIFGIITMLVVLSACLTVTETPSATPMLLGTPAQPDLPCEACAQATLDFALTQVQDSADSQAKATAEIFRANAQATLNSANATLSAVQTQVQKNANVIAAQIASTAQFERANAQATLISANSTQSAALTQDAIRQTQVADQATTVAQATLVQQNKNDLASSTETAVANNIATQTQAAVATSQSYADQRARQRQVPILFLWMCLSLFLVLFAGLALWGFWRWLRIRQTNQSMLENPGDRLQAPKVEVLDRPKDGSSPYLESYDGDSRYPLTKPDDQVRGWLDEVKRKLRRSDKKDEDDKSDD